MLVGVLKTPPTVFYGVAAAALAAEAGVVALSGNPVVDVLAGIPLVAVAGASAVAGSVLSSGIPIPSGGATRARTAPRAAAPAAQASAAPAASAKKGGRPAAAKVKVAAVKVGQSAANAREGCWWGDRGSASLDAGGVLVRSREKERQAKACLCAI